MMKLDTISYSFLNKEYRVAIIPDAIVQRNDRLLIGPHSLNLALYDDEGGYTSDEAKAIDEEIYAFVDDEFFSLGYEEFIKKVKKYLD